MIDLVTNLLGERILAVKIESSGLGSNRFRHAYKLIGVVRAAWIVERGIALLMEQSQAGSLYGYSEVPPGTLAAVTMSDTLVVVLPAQRKGELLQWCEGCGLHDPGKACHCVDKISIRIEDGRVW